jgi:SAM-dependent methyltransferase
MTATTLVPLGASVVGVDLETHDNGDLPPEVELVEGDYLSQAERLGTFDVVLALDSIEHFAGEAEVIAALAMNLAPGGHLITTVPAYKFLWSSHDDTNMHYRRYTAKRLRSALESSDLEVLRVGYVFAGLTLPKIMLSAWERLSGNSAPAGTEVGGSANAMAARYFEFETRFAKRRKNFLPFGTSVIGVARRRTENDSPSAF